MPILQSGVIEVLAILSWIHSKNCSRQSLKMRICCVSYPMERLTIWRLLSPRIKNIRTNLRHLGELSRKWLHSLWRLKRKKRLRIWEVYWIFSWRRANNYKRKKRIFLNKNKMKLFLRKVIRLVNGKWRSGRRGSDNKNFWNITKNIKICSKGYRKYQWIIFFCSDLTKLPTSLLLSRKQ